MNTLPYSPPTRRIHWTTAELVESIANATGRQIEFGRDDQGDYGAVTTREGTEYRARLAVTA